MRPSAISRRQFVVGAGVVGVSAAGLGLLTGCERLPFHTQTQPPAKIARIGYLTVGPQTSPIYRAAILQGLQEHGYIEGQSIAIEWRSGEGNSDRLRDLAAELVRLDVDVIIAAGGAPPALAARTATSTIPIVFTSVGDPVATGLVASLGRPGGNLTGLSLLSAELSRKRLELLTDSVPGASRVAVLWNPANPANALAWHGIQDAARLLGVGLQSLEVRQPDELDSAFGAAVRERAGALIALTDTLVVAYRTRVVDLATSSRLPVMYFYREFVDAGGLMSYGPDQSVLNRRAAYFVDRILKGTKPADLPVEQPMTFDFVVNLKTARDLGLTIPNEIMLQVTEVIQ